MERGRRRPLRWEDTARRRGPGDRGECDEVSAIQDDGMASLADEFGLSPQCGCVGSAWPADIPEPFSCSPPTARGHRRAAQAQHLKVQREASGGHPGVLRGQGERRAQAGQEGHQLER
jgi:hypothetical protein